MRQIKYATTLRITTRRLACFAIDISTILTLYRIEHGLSFRYIAINHSGLSTFVIKLLCILTPNRAQFTAKHAKSKSTNLTKSTMRQHAALCAICRLACFASGITTRQLGDNTPVGHLLICR